MSNFDQEWLTGTASYLDDVLWPAVVNGSRATAGATDTVREAAWSAYCELDQDAELKALIEFIQKADLAGISSVDLYPLIQGHRALDPLIDAVNEAIDKAAEDEDEDEDDEDV